MFFSVHLLSKKAPLGQIWIAAVLSHKKVTRRTAALIDIADACERILQPETPIALRLSGILMAGVVKVFYKKVEFLLEDAQIFMRHIRVQAATHNADAHTSRKAAARFQDVTLENGSGTMPELPVLPDFLPFADDIGEFVVLPEPSSSTARWTAGPSNQAPMEDITLPDAPDPTKRSDFLASMDEFLPPMDVDAEQPPDSDAPTFRRSDNADGNRGVQLSPIVEDPGFDKNPLGDDDDIREGENAGQEEAADDPVNQRKHKRARTAATVDDDTQISQAMFKEWQRNPADLIDTTRSKIVNAPVSLDAFLSVPAMFTDIGSRGIIVSMFPPELMGIFEHPLVWNGPGHPGDQPDAQEHFSTGRFNARMDASGRAIPSPVELVREVNGTPVHHGGTPDLVIEGSIEPGGRAGGSGERSDGSAPHSRSRRQLDEDFDCDQSRWDGEDVLHGLGAHMDFSGSHSDFLTVRGVFTTLESFQETYETQDIQHDWFSSRTLEFKKFFYDFWLNPASPETLNFDAILKGCTRHQAAVAFSEVLTLVTRQYLVADQPKPFAPILLKADIQLRDLR